MKTLLFIFVFIFSYIAMAMNQCKQTEKGFSFFNNKKSVWDSSKTVQIVDCTKSTELLLQDAQSKKILDRVEVSRASGQEKWQLDNLKCRQSKASKGLSQNLAILGDLAAVQKNPESRLKEVWAVDPVKKKWVQLDAAQVVCH